MDAPGLRVSDADREVAAARLAGHAAAGRLTTDELEERTAAALRAVTVGQLAALEGDLPEATGAVAPAARLEAPTELNAVLGTTRQTGPWRVGGPLRSRAILGECVIDLREAELPDAPVQLRALSVLGAITILVPEGTVVELSGSSILGERSVRVPRATSPGAVLELRATAVLGTVTVTTETDRERNLRRLRQAGRLLGR